MLGLGGSGRETFYFDEPSDSPGAIAQTAEAMVKPTLPPRLAGARSAPEGSVEADGWVGRTFRWLFLTGLLAGLALVAFRHPFIGRRILIMCPTLVVISIVVFTIIQ
jgi:hypothetical protein